VEEIFTSLTSRSRGFVLLECVIHVIFVIRKQDVSS